MDLIRRKLRSGVRLFEVLTIEEARTRNLVVVPWREGKGGDWVSTDDGYVCECLDRKVYRRDNQVLMVLAFCRQWVRGSTLNYLDYKKSGHFGGTSPRSWQEVESGRTRTKLMVKTFVQMLLSRSVDYVKLGTIYRQDQTLPGATARRLLKQEVIRKMVDAEMEKVLTEKGITRGSVLDMYLEAAQLARAVSNPTALKSVATELADFLEMKPRQVKQIDSAEFTGIDRQISDGIEKETKLKLSRETNSSTLEVKS